MIEKLPWQTKMKHKLSLGFVLRNLVCMLVHGFRVIHVARLFHNLGETVAKKI